MSDFKVVYTKILDVQPHSGADRLELVTIYGFQVIVSKGKYQVGDKIIYTPIDSILPESLEAILFPEGSKVKLYRRRVRQIRLRKLASQGLVIDPQDVAHIITLSDKDLETDISQILKIEKYEPPTPSFQKNTTTSNQPRNKPFTNPYFREYKGIENFKWFPNLFKEDEVVMQEKLHGSHIRFSKAPFVANTFWKKILKFFGFAPSFENVWGSNKVELTNRTKHTGYYGSDIYSAAIEKLKCFDKIQEGEFIHAELIGPGIQKGYTYGHKEHHIVIFDVRVLQQDGTQKWLNPEEVETYAKERGFDMVPVLYVGTFSEDLLKKHTVGPSVYSPSEKIREGCVVKSRYFYDTEGGKKALKSINPDYLDGDHGDNH